MRDRTEKLEALFVAVVELAPQERSAYLAQLCANDQELRAEVQRLVRNLERAGNFLADREEVSAQESSRWALMAEKPGERIGRYKLLEQIGEGGSGDVYMAEQEEPVRRRVALKIIKLGMDTKSVIARFEAERQALALMDHPNIAKVHDAGATESGRPYFVMELVRGTKITEYCDQNNLPTRERLDLFVPVCQAIQHAHQKGIIHRDIKPSNILVTLNDGVAVPKVIDFGIAKATTDQRLTDKTVFTAFEQFIGTPAYMSPEQAELTSLDIDTRSDIYSLGVLLYELLTGKTPFDSKELLQAGLDEMRRTIREKEPPMPSTRVSTMSGDELTVTAKRRGLEPPKLISQLRGDLDWIVVKSLEKDRTRRYETANGLARDIQRHLTNEPVMASPPSRSYQFQKLVRRNMVAFAAAGAVGLALAVGAVVSSQEAVRARRAERVQTRLRSQAQTEAAILEDMLSGAGPSAARGRDTTMLREILDKTAERVRRNLTDQPEIQGDLNSTLASTYRDLDDFQQALVLQQRAVDEYRAAFGNQHWKIALALGRLGFTQRRLNDALVGREFARAGLQMARLCGERRTLAACLYYMARSLDQYFTPPEGEPYAREAVAIQKELGDDPVTLAEYMSTLANYLNDAETNEAETENLYRQALHLHRQYLGNDHPSVVRDLCGLAQCLLNKNKLDEAKAAATEAVDVARKIFRKDHRSVWLSLIQLRDVLTARGEWSEAEAVMRRAVEEAPSSGWLWVLLGEFEARRQQWTAAIADFSRAAELDPDMRKALAIALLRTGRSEEYRGVCHTLLADSAASSNFAVADGAAKVSLLLPVEGTDFERACQLADFTVTGNESERNMAWYSLCKALADYRRNRFESALDWAIRASNARKAQVECKCAALFIQAAAYGRLNSVEPASTALAGGDHLMKERHKDPSDYGEWATEWVIADVLRSEARKYVEAVFKANDAAAR